MLKIGSIIDGKYKILNKVGQGGMSVVYLAMNEKANKQWAIKEVRKDGVKDFELIKQGLIVETDMLKKLSHPSLPSIVDVIEDDNTFLIVMDYIQGNPLSKTLEEYGAQSQENVVEWAKQLCDVLGYLHSRKPPIIYRDMKPANVMLKPDGSITLIDFGTAREYKSKNIADTTCLGTIGYAAPEQFGGMGQTDARTDIYCLGATLYHLVTGMNPCEPPYEIKPIRQINPALSNGLEKIIMKCTQRDPDARYQSCAELMYDLEHFDEMDNTYRRKMKFRLGIFITSVILTIGFGCVAIWGNASAENVKSKNYSYILSNAKSLDDYYNAILTDPSKTDAYIELVNYLRTDTLTKEEADGLNQLQAGLDRKNSNGYSETVNVLEELKEKNYDGYIDVCYEFGNAFLFSSDTTNDRERYVNASKWFSEAKNKYEMASIFCDIASCLQLIDQNHQSTMVQKGKELQEYKNLWDKLTKLESKINGLGKTPEESDTKINVINSITNIIYNNANGFVNAIKNNGLSYNEINTLLNDMNSNLVDIDDSIYKEQKQQVSAMISDTIEKYKITSAEKGSGNE
ncbi:serine/threonine protein kinase [Clostridium sp. AM09-51]|uniref:serine/threonine protein kinase n=1 Tax=Pseudoruminococcus massiliensis TaxID=2086583 RepID=UPI000E49E45F|nr:serine/threonine-protein kinase [Pseudoruminococcus massiliensis]RHO49732.1 serine/threonine protein kinase [Clostridium sp. AM09-51]